MNMNPHAETSCCSAHTKAEDKLTKEVIKDEDKTSKSPSSSKQGTTLSVGQEDDELENTRGEMIEVKKENERLKKMLQKMENDYKSLQMRFFDILQRDESPSTLSENKSQAIEESQIQKEEPEVSLCLGLQIPNNNNNNNNNKRKKLDHNYDHNDHSSTSSTLLVKEEAKLMSQGLSLGLDFKGPINLSDEGSEKSTKMENDAKGDGMDETCPPSKVLTTGKEDDVKELDESSQGSNTKRARVSVRARCDTPTMNDGCQWRKYGQKIAKGNPCPRAYYRCTVAPLCPVRKQVQRCSSDMSILITTYEGTHNHPLPISATAMASTTSAAASILLSGSSSSHTNLLTSSSAPLMTTTNLNGLNFTLYHNNNNNPRSNTQFNIPSSSSPTPPTITLDLTSTHPSSHFNKHHHNNTPLLTNFSSSTSLDFSSSQVKPTFPLSWSNSNSNSNNTHLNYSTLFPLNNNKTLPSIGSINFGTKPMTFEQTNYLERIKHIANTTTTTSSSCSSSSQQFLTETLTKVLTSDPSFQSAVAAAISSMVGTTNINSESLSQNMMKWVDQNGNGYLMNKSPSSSIPNSQPGGGGYNMLLQPQLPFSLSKSSSSSDLRERLD